MHRRKDFFSKDAKEFCPERWERSQHSWVSQVACASFENSNELHFKEVLGQYLPFNGGLRICIGQQYALTEITYVLVRLVQEFVKVEACDPLPWKELLSLTLGSANRVHVRLRPV
jgi:cytochrome P450